MADRPLLIFPESELVVRRFPSGRRGRLHTPSAARQAERIQPEIDELVSIFNARQRRVTADPQGANPEDVLVLEVVGTIEEFEKSVMALGLEWLVDGDIDNIIPDDDFYMVDRKGAIRPTLLAGKLYLVLSNQVGLQRIVRLWQEYVASDGNPSFVRGQGKWRDFFLQVHSLRTWDWRDRLRETELSQATQEIEEQGQQAVPIEVELWFRQDANHRARVRTVVEERVRELGGEVVSETTVGDIRYHALLAWLPLRAVQQIEALRETRLINSGEIMYLWPAGQVAFPTAGDPSEVGDEDSEITQLPSGQPIAALLDGLPLTNHRKLAGRLAISDSRGWESDYQVLETRHGTAMASLIIHGDLGQSSKALSRPLYVSVIMRPDQENIKNPHERIVRIPAIVSPIDIVQLAVRRMFQSSGSHSPEAPTVRIINLSMGDPSKQFDRIPSAWARLLDTLAWKHKVLFVVSSGNHQDSIELHNTVVPFAEIRTDRDRLASTVFTAVNESAGHRRLLAPAEAVNALTVGATHSDESGAGLAPSHLVDPFPAGVFPSPVNAQGRGFRRAVKPDVLMPGGRAIYYAPTAGVAGSPRLTMPEMYRGRPGQRTASPGPQAGDLNHFSWERGTSNAAALTTRLGAQLYDVVEELRRTNSRFVPTDDCIAPLLKAMVVHGASWGESGRAIDNILDDKSRNARIRHLGYGEVEAGRVFECTADRVTLLSSGLIGDGEAHLFELPLPPGLSGQKVERRVIITLAWLTPVSLTNQVYRSMALWFDTFRDGEGEEKLEDILGLNRKEVLPTEARRGTVQHEILQGDAIKVIRQGHSAYIQVNCRTALQMSPKAKTLLDPVPYGLAVTLDVKPGLGISIYDQVRESIRQRSRERVMIPISGTS